MYWVRQWKSVTVPSASRLWLMEDLLPGQHTKVFSFSEGPNQWVRKFFIFWNNDYLCHQWKTTLAEKAELILEHPGAQWLDHGPKSWVESSQAEGGCEAEFLIYIYWLLPELDWAQRNFADRFVNPPFIPLAFMRWTKISMLYFKLFDWNWKLPFLVFTLVRENK